MVIGLSPTPTRYALRVAGILSYVRCGADLLLTGRGTDLEAEARCPVCERAIRFAMRGGRVQDLQPAGTLLHVVERRGPGICYIECEATHLFDRRECVQEWLNAYGGPPGAVMSPQSYVDDVRRTNASSPTEA